MQKLFVGWVEPETWRHTTTVTTACAIAVVIITRRTHRILYPILLLEIYLYICVIIYNVNGCDEYSWRPVTTPLGMRKDVVETKSLHHLLSIHVSCMDTYAYTYMSNVYILYFFSFPNLRFLERVSTLSVSPSMKFTSYRTYQNFNIYLRVFLYSLVVVICKNIVAINILYFIFHPCILT